MEHNVIKIESLKMKYLESVFIVELMMISIYWAIDTTRCVYTMGIAQNISFFHDFMQIRFTVVLQNRFHPAYSTIKYTVQICSICKTDTTKTHTKIESGKTSRF